MVLASIKDSSLYQLLHGWLQNSDFGMQISRDVRWMRRLRFRGLKLGPKLGFYDSMSSFLSLLSAACRSTPKAIYLWVKRHGRDLAGPDANTPGSSTSSLSGTGMWRYDSQWLSCLQRDRRKGGEMTGGQIACAWCPWLTSAVGHGPYSLETIDSKSPSGLVSQNSLSWPVPLVASNISAATSPHTGVLSPQRICFRPDSPQGSISIH